MAIATQERRKLTPRAVARQYGVAADKVLHWINTGQLRAFNGATDPDGQRPRWLIDVDDLSAFEERRAATPSPKVTRRRTATAGKDYFPAS